jgi:exonuclease SbcC
VCGNEVRDLVDHEAADLRDAEQAEQRARRSAEAMDRAAAEATANLARAEDLLTELRGQLVDVESAVAEAPAAAAIDQQLRAIEAAGEELRRRRADEQAARKALDGAERGMVQAEATTSGGWKVFDATRDRLAVMEPPAPDRSDLAGAWRALDAWTSAQAAQFTDELAVIEKEVLELTGRHEQEMAGVRQACAAAEVEVGRHQLPRDAAIEALADAKADLASIEDAVARLAELDAEVSTLATTAEVAAALGRHLGAKGFEKWVLDEALDRLIAGASSVLYDLSDHAYSLVLDTASSTFFVKDHFNADALRSARTLSGGETFLASLALALALADQVAELAAGGAVRLESIFLDEGFGTLDPDTLDTVATAIEELGAQGRMVGVVSHVAALAERMPVRFVVTKGPTTSTVVREDA